MEGSPSIDGNHRPKRASRACQRCHSRKVRCDATVNGFPCTNCRLDAVPCQAFLGTRGRRKELARVRALAIANGTGKELLPSRAASRRAGRVPSPGEGTRPAPLAYSQYPFIQPVAMDRLERSKALFIETQECLSLPQKSEVDAFVRHYFLYVHPFAPLFDEAAFCRAYRDARPGSTQISLTVFRAMMFSASCVGAIPYPSDIVSLTADSLSRKKWSRGVVMPLCSMPEMICMKKQRCVEYPPGDR